MQPGKIIFNITVSNGSDLKNIKSNYTVPENGASNNILHLHGIDHFQSNGTSLAFLLLDLDLYFQDQTFCILFPFEYFEKIVRDRANKSKHYYCHKIEVRYLPSHGATANVIHHDFDLHFQDQEF